MNVNKKEWEALHGSIDHLNNLIEGGAEGASADIINENIQGLNSIISKVRKDDSARTLRNYVKKISQLK